MTETGITGGDGFDLRIRCVHGGCIVVLSINKSVEPNEEQKVMMSSFDQGFTVTLANRFSGVFGIAGK